MVKTAKLSDIRKRNAERRERGLQAAKRVNPSYYPGMRAFDKPRNNPEKQRILEELQEREYDLQHK
ncbi:hypothetical protein LNK15_08095 [Jeotgalicoccus huakuii]|nr:hypothetical protein [Jeotgalicoccus huakuii]